MQKKQQCTHNIRFGPHEIQKHSPTLPRLGVGTGQQDSQRVGPCCNAGALQYCWGIVDPSASLSLMPKKAQHNRFSTRKLINSFTLKFR